MRHDTISIVPKPKGPATSWWTQYAAPGQRAHFIEAAKTRHDERTKADDLREGKKNQAMRHVISPSQFPPLKHEGKR